MKYDLIKRIVVHIAKKNIKGFTLIELSIVIVIIGLIISGITAGRSLVRSAQLSSVISEVNSYNTAINAFKLQYGYYPGDLPTAFNYWGTNCAATSTACNGNGNNIIMSSTGGHGWEGECLMVWKHMALAGLITGTYSGTYTTYVKIGTDVPASKLPKAGYHLPAMPYINIEIGAETGQDRPVQNILSGPEAAGIDIKIDDGIPTSGKVRGDVYGYADYRDFSMGGSWSTASCISGSAYVTTNTAKNSCRLGFIH